MSCTNGCAGGKGARPRQNDMLPDDLSSRVITGIIVALIIALLLGRL